MSKNHLLLAFLCSFCFTLNVSADYIDGQRAYANGDYGVAILEWTQVAEDGNARAQYNLGWMHANGKGTAQDFKEAIKWYTESAQQGNVNAQYNLGNLYLRGKELPKMINLLLAGSLKLLNRVTLQLNIILEECTSLVRVMIKTS